MLNPDRNPGPTVSAIQARVIMNATPEPQAGSALNDGATVGRHWHLFDMLVTAGFLTRHERGKRVLYARTPDGEAFAAFLYRMEEAREQL